MRQPWFRKLAQQGLQRSDRKSVSQHILSLDVEMDVTTSLDPAQRCWKPLALRRRTLVGYATLSIILVATFVTLYQVSKRNSGFVILDTRLHYLWVYSPSAVFIIIAGYWYLTEANAKLLAPWRVLSDRTISSSRRLRQDYVSQLRYTSLYQSLRNKDWTVFLALMGTFCLQLLIIVSTGLLILQPTVISRTNTIFPLTTSLNKSATYVEYSDNALHTAYAVRTYGLEFPLGTTSRIAYQALNNTALSPGSEAQATVDALYPAASCEIASANWTYGVVQSRVEYSNITRRGPGAHLVFGIPSCQYQSASIFPGPRSAFEKTNNGYETFDLSLIQIRCDGSQQKWPTHVAVTASKMTLNDTSINGTTPTFSNITTKSFAGESWNLFGPLPSKMLSSNAAAVICKLDPKFGKARLTSTRSSVRAELLPESIHEAHLNETLGPQLLNVLSNLGIINSPYLSGYNMTWYRGRNSSVVKFGGGVAPFFQLVNSTDRRDHVGDFVDSKYLMSTVGSTLELIAAQLVAKSLFMPTNETVAGVLTETQGRLVVNSLAFGVSMALLGLMICISLALALQRQETLSKNPGTLINMATILTRTPDVIDIVRHLHQAEKKVKEHKRLRSGGHTADVNLSLSFSIPMRAEKQATVLAQQDEKGHIKVSRWWQPWNMSLSHRFLTVILPALCIVLLEILLRRSEKFEGLARVSSSKYIQYLWMYIPVVVILSLNCLFDATSFTNRIIQPYVTMRNRPAPASQSISVDFVNRTTMSAMFKAVRLGQFGVALAIMATLLGAVLPIAASGLFKTQNTLQQTSVRMNQVTYFDPSAAITVPQPYPENLPIPGLIHMSNLSYPAWTYGKYAFPRLKLTGQTRNNSGTLSPEATIRVDVPAVYGVANCSSVPRADISYFVNFTLGGRSGASVDPGGSLRPMLYVEGKPLSGCPRMRCDKITMVPDFYESMWKGAKEIFDSNNTGTAPEIDRSQNSSSASFHGGYKLPAHCPLSTMCIMKGEYPKKWLDEDQGEWNYTGTVKMDDVKVLYCNPYVAQEIVTLDLRLPDLDISSLNPPKPQPGTRMFFSEAELLNTANMRDYLPWYSTIRINNATSMYPDSFFGAIFSGKDAFSPLDLLTKNAATMDLFLDHIDNVYSLVVSQIYSEMRRFPVDISNTEYARDGTLIETVGRVHQDALSTRIIQVLLGSMIICALLSMFFTNGWRVLPKRPCSIVTVAGLIERSSLLSKEITSPNREFLGVKALQERGALQHGLFSLGWWGEKGDRWYGIDLGQADKEE